MFNQDSYQKHEAYIEQNTTNNSSYLESLYDSNSPIYHYNQAFFRYISPLISTASRWLTVGDATGIDAAFIKRSGGHATATDLSAKTLENIKQRGFIDDFSVQNVEQITYPDNHFDYVCCKEAYHHFPRPPMGFYEMLRVAKQGVVIMEPIDINLSFPPVLFLRNILDRFSTNWLKSIWRNQYSYEVVGNFVYKVSLREFEKMAVALDLPCIAYRGFNTMMNARWSSRTSQFLQQSFFDLLTRLSLLPYQHGSIVVFKQQPSTETLEKLRKEGYQVYHLPKNPYN